MTSPLPPENFARKRFPSRKKAIREGQPWEPLGPLFPWDVGKETQAISVRVCLPGNQPTVCRARVLFKVYTTLTTFKLMF